MQTEFIAETDKQEIFLIRDFDAPRELVFRAHADHEWYEQWIAPQGFDTKLEEFKPEEGGKWRYVQTDREGNQRRFSGVNHSIIPPELIVTTFELEGFFEEGHVALETIKFEALSDDKTRVIDQSVFQSVADRDRMLESDIANRVNDSYERLDDFLARELAKIKFGKGIKKMLYRFFRL